MMICGISALGLVLIMGLAMKFKLKRDNGKGSVQVVCGIRQHRSIAKHLFCFKYIVLNANDDDKYTV